MRKTQMARRGAFAGVALLALAGCAGSQGHMRLLEQDGALRVSPSANPAANYTVSIRNIADVGYNPDDKAVRDKLALDYLRTQCPSGRIVGETVLETGEYLLGRPARTYAIDVKC